jgi:hypothetical protein
VLFENCHKFVRRHRRLPGVRPPEGGLSQ